MYFYEIALLGSPLEPLTYASSRPLKIGAVVTAEVRNRTVQGVAVKEVAQPDFSCKEVQYCEEYFTEETLAFARFIASYYLCSLGESLSLFAQKKLPILESLESIPMENLPILSKEQNQALASIQKENIALLFGDTGSGKTEIYITLLAEALAQGKNGILLMPEISLTPQMEKRLKKHFGEKIVIWHSKVTKKRKAEILEKIEKGEVRIVAGARSALFLQMPHIGIVIVDEEHDDAYKSQSRPRYNARDLAVYLADKSGAKALLGSATPSLNSYVKYTTIRLKGQYFAAKKEAFFIEESPQNTLGKKTLDMLEQNLARGNQAVLFVPTRANFKYMVCAKCFEFVTCPYCSISMSVHARSASLRCHYCGYSEQIPSTCPSCGSEEFENKRFGTAEVSELLKEALPNARIERFDRDEIKSEKLLKERLKAFNAHEIDILVGTQMITKGHDYHNVALSVILGIDYILKSADFRARERAISLAIQSSGRSGRKGEGKVLIQTSNAEMLQEYLFDYDKFLKEERGYREGYYPPFVKLALLQFSHQNEHKAKEAMEQTLRNLGRFPNVEILGSGESPIKKIAAKYRYRILLRAQKIKPLLEAIENSKNELCEVDIEPYSLT